ncbi:pyridoxal phosphate-dependent decarboxylase family protein [Staphylococcus delphini]|uniref:pyridoxal phosphate-dependent decarboxylase family protein n=1 Tax=Staphylococcus delphini TaxID=53344 RepID=UPI000BBBE261|nr:aminotransferase class I/II-fold pyridoxal phosphate-dependent enzyme [Staphylococcus delphini]PCF41638.1 pyridoxal-dependent decarboxylase [Staphylococcus delphini]
MNKEEKYQISDLKHVIDSEISFLLNRPLTDLPVTQITSPNLISKYEQMPIPKKGKGLRPVMDLLHREVLNSHYLPNHPRMFSFVPGPASQLSWLTDILTSGHNIHASNFNNAPLPITIEHRLIHYLSTKIGFDPILSGGLFVSGGSMATLTAIVAGRDATIAMSHLSKATVYFTAQAHFSVAKAFHVAGFAPSQRRHIPTSDDHTMDVSALQAQIKQDIADGYQPTMVVVTTGTTNTGAVDDLEAITQIAHQHDIWVHADGAYGLSHIFTEEGRRLLKGIEAVDSVTWDAHKLLFQTYSCAMVIVKDKQHLLSSYSTGAEYLDDITNQHDALEPEKLGIELSRPPRGLKLWVTLQVLGENEIKLRIEHGQKMARYAGQQVEKMAHWTIVTPPQFSVVTFRYNDPKKTPEENNQIMKYTSSRIAQSGYAIAYTTELNEQRVIRLCTINPETTTRDIDETLQRLDQYVRDTMSTP